MPDRQLPLRTRVARWWYRRSYHEGVQDERARTVAYIDAFPTLLPNGLRQAVIIFQWDLRNAIERGDHE